MDAAYAAAYADVYRRHWWWRVRERILLDTIQTYLGPRSNAAILDIGCGAGLFFDALARFGCVEGIESDHTAVQQSGRWRGRIHNGQLDTFASDRKFDLILMLDVLEHIDTPEHVLRRAAGFLARDGLVLITVPAFNALWTSHDDLNRHLRRYTAADLRRLINDAGLVTLRTQFLFQSLTVGKLLVRAKESIVPSPPAVPRVPPMWLNRTLEMWFRYEHATVGRLPLGSSVMAVARHAHA